MKKRLNELNALELQSVLAEVSQRLHQRSEPIALAVLDTLDQWIAMAEDPGNPHYVVAKTLIRRWVDTQERMQAIASGIHLAK
jgi:hypothetical protein